MFSRKAQAQILSVVLLTGIAVAVVTSSYFWGKPLIQKSRTGSEMTQAENIMLRVSKAIDEVSSQGGQRVVEVKLAGILSVEGAIENEDGSLLYLNKRNAVDYVVDTQVAGTSSTIWVPLNGFSPIRQEVATAGATEALTINETQCSQPVINCPEATSSFACDDGGSANGGEGAPVLGGTSTAGYKIGYVYCGSNPFVAVYGPDEFVTGVIGADKAGVIVMRTKPKGDIYETEYKLVYRELVDLTTSEGKLIQIVQSGNNIATEGSHRIIIKAENAKTYAGASSTGETLTVLPILVTVD